MTLKSCSILGFTLSPSPHLEHGLTEPNEKQHYLIVSKADYLWLQNPHFRQCNTLLRRSRATTPLHAMKDCEEGGVLISFLMQTNWRKVACDCFVVEICSNTDRRYLPPSLQTLSAICRWVTHALMYKYECVWASLPTISHSDWLLPCHSHAVGGWVGEAYCHGSVNACFYVCVLSRAMHRTPSGTLETPASCVSCQVSVELRSYFELFHPHLKSCLPCSHFPCPPTWNWGFTALNTKVVLSFIVSAFHHSAKWNKT